MAKKSRFVILAFFVFIFLLTTPLIVLNARGYQFNFEEKKLINTGGVFLKSTPKKASIYLNNKLMKVQTPAIINGLMPGEYLVDIELSDFYSWQKQLEIESGMMVKQDSILLLPKKPKTTLISELPKIIIEKKENKLKYDDHEIWLESESENKSNNDDQEEIKLITRYAEKIKQAFLHKDQEHVIFLVGNQVKFVEIDGTNTVDFIKADKILYQDSKLYILQKQNWFLTEFD